MWRTAGWFLIGIVVVLLYYGSDHGLFVTVIFSLVMLMVLALIAFWSIPRDLGKPQHSDQV